MARQLQIFGVHVHCGIRGAGEGDPDRQRAARLPAALPRAVGVLAVLDRCGHRPGVRTAEGLRGAADRRAALPALRLGRSSRSTWSARSPRTPSSRSARCGGTSARTPNFGTVELRICDGLPTLDEIGCVAALAQCLVERFDRQLDDGYTLPDPGRGWCARTSGGRPATAWTPRSSSTTPGTVQPVNEALADLVEDLLPIARRLGCAAELEPIRG